jgi:hypothetical protein
MPKPPPDASCARTVSAVSPSADGGGSVATGWAAKAARTTAAASPASRGRSGRTRPAQRPAADAPEVASRIESPRFPQVPNRKARFGPTGARHPREPIPPTLRPSDELASDACSCYVHKFGWQEKPARHVPPFSNPRPPPAATPADTGRDALRERLLSASPHALPGVDLPGSANNRTEARPGHAFAHRAAPTPLPRLPPHYSDAAGRRAPRSRRGARRTSAPSPVPLLFVRTLHKRRPTTTTLPRAERPPAQPSHRLPPAIALPAQGGPPP